MTTISILFVEISKHQDIDSIKEKYRDLATFDHLHRIRQSDVDDWFQEDKDRVFNKMQDPSKRHELKDKLKTIVANEVSVEQWACLLYTSPSPRDRQKSRMPSSA